MKDKLRSLGFTDNLATVYVALIEHGESPASSLIDVTDLHRNIAYNNLDRLVKRGLATYVNRDGRRIYQATDPSSLVESFQDKKKEIEEQIDEAESVADTIRRTTSDKPETTMAQLHEGSTAIKSYLRQRADRDVDVMGAPLRSLELLGEVWWQNYRVKLRSNEVSVRLLLNPGLDVEAERIDAGNVQIRFLPEAMQPKTEIRIYDEEIAQIHWHDPPVLIQIASETAMTSHQEYFDFFWHQVS